MRLLTKTVHVKGNILFIPRFTPWESLHNMFTIISSISYIRYVILHLIFIRNMSHIIGLYAGKMLKKSSSTHLQSIQYISLESNQTRKFTQVSTDLDWNLTNNSCYAISLGILYNTLIFHSHFGRLPLDTSTGDYWQQPTFTDLKEAKHYLYQCKIHET